MYIYDMNDLIKSFKPLISYFNLDHYANFNNSITQSPVS